MSEKHKLLVVDDDNAIVELLVTYLPRFNYDVTGLTDSVEALQRIKTEAYDIVLTDLVMPEVTGMEIVRAVKELGRDTQVIIATGYATTESAIEAVQQGVYDYIRKPFSPREIQVVLNRAAERLDMIRENASLTARVEKMLANIRMLYEISGILYQISDPQMVQEMILDTLAEGLNIGKAGIMLPTDGDDQYFRLQNACGLHSDFMSSFAVPSQISDRNGDNACPEPIHTQCSENGELMQRVENLNGTIPLVLYPICYHDKLYGYLVRFGTAQSEDLSDIDQLMEILATQIAPVFGGSGSRRKEGSTSSQRLPQLVRMDRWIHDAKTDGHPVAFAVLKLTFTGMPVEKDQFVSITSRFSSWVQEEFSSEAEILWQQHNCMMVIAPGNNSVDLELSTVNIRRRLEEQFTQTTSGTNISLQYNIVTYPEDGDTAEDLYYAAHLPLLTIRSAEEALEEA